MNTKIKLLITLVVSIYSFTDCNNPSSTAEGKKDSSTLKTSTMEKDSMNMDNDMMGSMNAMMDKMNSVKMSGDFDVDFTNMMIEHHQGAIDMSEEEVKSGTDEKIKSMAQNIISAQKEEMTKLQDFVKNYKTSGMKHGEGELQKANSNMMRKMKTIQMSGNIDKDFAIMMISHHENAVSMAKKELEYGMDTKLKQMAQKIINDQTKEINEFKSWLESKK